MNTLDKRFSKRVLAVLLTLLLGMQMGFAQDRLTVLSPQEPATLLPHFDLLTLTHEVQHLMFDCLFVTNDEGEYLPDLAAEVPTLANGGISADGTTYTIRLKEGVTWHDGEAFDAEDVLFTISMIQDENNPIPSRGVWAGIESMSAPDPSTVVLEFGSTNVAFLGAASSDACFIAPEHLLADRDLNAVGFHRAPVGTGPFEFEEWASGSFLRVSANPDYRDGQPSIDEVVVQFAGSQTARTSLQRGEADVALHIGFADVRFAQGLDGYEVLQAPDHAWWQFWINNEDPILSDLSVRRALAHGLDKQLIADTVFGGLTEPVDAVFPPTHWAHAADVTRYEYNPEGAAQLLEAAGWVDGDGDGVREKDGVRLEIDIVNIAGQIDRRQVVQAAQDMWNDLGFDITITEIDGASFPPTMAGGDFQLAYGWFGENQEPVFNLWLGTNWQNFGDESALDLLRSVSSTVDRAERASNIQAFQRIVADEVAILPVAQRPLLNVVSNRVDGYAPTLSGSLWNVASWSLR